MVSNSVVLRKTMQAKHTKTIIVADVVQMPSTYSINSVATWKMYIKCKEMKHPNNKNPKSTLTLTEPMFAV